MAHNMLGSEENTYTFWAWKPEEITCKTWEWMGGQN